MASGGADTRAEILRVALELFTSQGYQRTSLREIAERLGITKAALYYHFASKTDILREIVQPLVDDSTEMLETLREERVSDPRTVFEREFDLSYRHRAVFALWFTDLSVFQTLNLVGEILRWRTEVQTALLGPDATPAARVRATSALGGLQDCAVLPLDAPYETLRAESVEAALRALEPRRASES
ncbi:TetR/AcrR family transcriptional regulator [Spiractinospora alimapuensis]|uniref:TetR/AcrR family transcriptional regulator n=1 Tax=Spiractinospora alimapuensis TaxID=2820884 RepID=UPI001F483E1D|nr:TetR/AcrR family transcriptional regulator [Spiractinospora alimapuensis]QVQ50253.1 TetR/AcrR family transcriptional regulator [Spiractinospora alimapuensis]